MATNNKVTGGKKIGHMLETLGKKITQGELLHVGFFEKSKYSDGMPIAQVAFWNEFGTSRVPSRPFFRTTIQHRSADWGKLLAKTLPAAGYDGKKALVLVGQMARDDIENAIAQWSSPPNAPSTIARKGLDKPLIDTGSMQRAVDYEIKNK